MSVSEPSVRSGQSAFLVPSEVRQAVDLELLALLHSPIFQTSQRSCEFLRYVVENGLNGQFDALRERVIGVTLLGRDASYDTGSDAAVRVRASDVRKRLATYYENNAPRAGYRIDLPPGAYVPRFTAYVPPVEELPAPTAAPAPQVTPPKAIAPAPPVRRFLPFLELRYLAAPTVFALFVCGILLRQEIKGANGLQRFWSDLLQGKSRVSFVVPPVGPNSDTAALKDIRAALPLLNLMQSFQVEPVFLNSEGAADAALDTMSVRLDPNLPKPVAGRPDTRFVLEPTDDGYRVIDRQQKAALSKHAVLITIVRDGAPTVWISATDEDALQSGIQVLTSASRFPSDFVDQARHRPLSQVVFDERGRALGAAPAVAP